MKKYIRCAELGDGDSYAIYTLDELEEIPALVRELVAGGDIQVGETITLEVIEMTDEQFENLPGWDLDIAQISDTDYYTFAAARVAAEDRVSARNLLDAKAIAHTEAARAEEANNRDLYYAWNRVIMQLWAIEEAIERGQGV